MAIICRISLLDAEQFKGYKLKAKYEGKQHDVYFKLMCEDMDLEDCVKFAKESSNVLMLEYQGTGEKYSYMTKENLGDLTISEVVDFGCDVQEADVQRVIDKFPECLNLVIKVPDSFFDMKIVESICSKFPRVRFAGGKLFAFDNVKVGEIGVDVAEKSGVKFGADAYYIDCRDDIFEEVAFGACQIEKTKKVGGVKSSKSTSPKKKATETAKTSKASKPTKKPTKKSMHFGNLLATLRTEQKVD